MIQFTDQVLQDILDNIIDTGGALDPAAAFVGVYTAIAAEGVDTVLADLTQGAGGLATRVAVVAWGSPHKLQDGRWAVDAPIAEFRVTNAADAQTVEGFFLADAGTAGNLLGYANLPAPVPLPNEDYYVSIIFRLTVDPAGRWSSDIVYNG